MSSAAEAVLQRHRLSVPDYHTMGEAGVLPPDARVELVEGEIIDMAPIGSRHAGTLKDIVGRCAPALAQQAVLSVQDPVVLDDLTELQPDLALLRPRADTYRDSHPRPEDVLLIVEVAEASLRYDREIKVPLYARAGIVEVWIVDLKDSVLHIHRRPAAGYYEDARTITDPGSMDLAALPNVRIDLAGLF